MWRFFITEFHFSGFGDLVEISSVLAQPMTKGYQRTSWLMRTFAYAMFVFMLVYLLNNYLNVWHDWPGVAAYFFVTEPDSVSVLAWIQLFSYLLVIPVVGVYCAKTATHRMIEDSDRLSAMSGYLIRVAFWSIVLIGLIDGLISWLRVENLLPLIFSEDMANNLGRSDYRGTHVHYPLILISAVMAYRFKTVSVAWLALLVVFAEAWIVVARFIFSYEQTLMGDLVRFWYAGLFLFASAYTLREEGHVRVDVLYSGRTVRYKAWANTVGVLLLGLPLCWVVLVFGMWDRTSILNAPLLNFEISQAAYGLFIKYIMAAFLVVFAVSMLIQFCSYLLKHMAILQNEVEVSDDHHDEVGA
ncbi:Tripartite ATP-independent periplasmic transporter, DctQ component [Reinekea sp. MED297]|uniref:TRAP transporter small permease protein n=1 Tax=Reinekea blandensis MED297 TaxID=314283 RepID=A4BBS5_9GAMM|nr:Tripartite ATP-independent periplasmic transporter, DctQ component [Reinekea sp. MED297] [Reinekea blandensis MED297]